ncbi:MAG: hypothetical protein JW808_06870 [Victivallales bacterium]|nr:hypothetical protein [Victivallales bacterium]
MMVTMARHECPKRSGSSKWILPSVSIVASTAFSISSPQRHTILPSCHPEKFFFFLPFLSFPFVKVSPFCGVRKSNDEDFAGLADGEAASLPERHRHAKPDSAAVFGLRWLDMSKRNPTVSGIAPRAMPEGRGLAPLSLDIAPDCRHVLVLQYLVMAILFDMLPILILEFFQDE